MAPPRSPLLHTALGCARLPAASIMLGALVVAAARLSPGAGRDEPPNGPVRVRAS